MDIDVTKKLRPPKNPEPPPRQVVPPPLSPQEVKTRRFVESMTVALGAEESTPQVEVDPITGWLVVMKGPGRGRSLPLGYGVHPLGRGEDQRISVRFGDKKISRRSHVEVVYDERSRAFHVLPGRGSTFGQVNGKPVTEAMPLRNGDRIAVGDTEMMFVPFCGEKFDWRQSV